MTRAHQSESLKERLITAVPVALFMYVVLSFPVLSDKGAPWFGAAIATFCILKAVFDHVWPMLRARLLRLGVPGWMFEDGDWRSNLVISGVSAAVIAGCAQVYGTRSWLEGTPLLAKFALCFALLFAITWMGTRVRRAMGLR